MNKYEGGSFEDFLKEEGIFEEVTESALKRLFMMEIENSINATKPKIVFKDSMNADFVQLNHYLFDLDNTIITSELLDCLIKEMNTEPVQFNEALCTSEELLGGFLTDEIAA